MLININLWQMIYQKKLLFIIIFEKNLSIFKKHFINYVLKYY